MFNENKFIIICGFLVAFAGLIWLIDVGMTRVEKQECERWQNEAKNIKKYFITEWQKQQCETVGVEVEAPVVSAGDMEEELYPQEGTVYLLDQ